LYEHFDLFTDFEYKGTWWIPENAENKLYGSLKFKHNNYILLELNGLFEKKSTFQLLEPEIILGTTNDGEKVTIFQSYESDFSGPAIDFESGSEERIGRQSFICKYIFVGETHFNRSEDMVFNYLVTNFTYLDQWLNNYLKVEKNENEYVIKVNPIVSKLKIDSMKTTLTVSSYPFLSGKFSSTMGGGTDQVNIKYNSGLVIAPDGPKNLKWFEDFITNLGNLLTLFIGFPVYPIRLYGEVAGTHDYNITNIYRIIENPQYVECVEFLEMDNRYPELIKYSPKYKNPLADVINTWFEKSELLGPVYDLISITFYDSSMYARTYFLTLMQGIETFHRRVYGSDGKYLDDEEYEPIRERFISAIPKEIEDDFKASLIAKFDYLNEFSLRKRIKDLKNCSIGKFNYYNPIMGDDPNLISKLVDTRNYHTHFDKKEEKNIFSDDELPRINTKLRLFLRVLLLDQINPEKILDTMGICTRYETQLYRDRVFQESLELE